jgi:tetratricopeptide (TPR) repeat protein
MFALFALLLMAPSGTRAEADALFQAGRYRDAALSYAALLRQTPGDTGLLDALGQTLREMRQPRAAIPYFQREVALDPANRVAARSLAAALQEANALEDARRLLMQLVHTDPEDAESWYLLGLLMYRNGYYSAAIEDLDQALARGPGGGISQYRNRAESIRAISLLQAGRAAEAREALPKLLEKPGNAADLDLLLAYARVLYEDGRYADAMKQTDLAAAANPANASAHFWRARISQQQGLIAQAIGEAERSRDLAPDSPAPRSLLVRLYQRSGRAADAAREADWLRLHEARAAAP